MIKKRLKYTFHSVALSRMSCMLSLKTVAKKKNKEKRKLDFTCLRRCHSLAEEPTEKKSSQALQQAILTLILTVPILSLGGGYGRFFRMGLIRLYIYPNVSV